MNKNTFEEADKIPDGICIVCGHSLSNHIDERDVWRCHSLGQDFYQCECALRKDRSASWEGRLLSVHIGEPDISYYDLKKRIKKQSQESKSFKTTEELFKDLDKEES